MEIVNFATSDSIINQYVAELRDVGAQANRSTFRHNLQRIGHMMAYEVSKTLQYSQKQIRTPLGTAQASTPDDHIVLATVFRAGLPFHHGFQNILDRADNAFISAFRKYKDRLNFEVMTEYIASPSIEGKTLILTDPMLATGSSMELAYKAILAKGNPGKVYFASIIASQPAIDYLQTKMPEESVCWTAALDPELNEHSYIVPGLGDAGDLAFGTKED